MCVDLNMSMANLLHLQFKPALGRLYDQSGTRLWRLAAALIIKPNQANAKQALIVA